MITILAAISIFFSPHGGCTSAIVKEIGAAKTSIRVQAFGFTSTPISTALVAAKQRGVDVQVILDSGWPAQASKVAPQLAAASITLLSDAKHAIAHNKVIVIDGVNVITGSFNFTNQAELMNAENIVVIKSLPKVGAIFTANWNAHAAHSTIITNPNPTPAPSSTP